MGHKCQLARDKNDHFHLVDPRLDLKIERTTRLLPPMDSIKIYKNTHTFLFSLIEIHLFEHDGDKTHCAH